ncbi:MAG TPA: glycosyltransferase family 4 protein, partial [Pyrinomonadaceae bacterium]
ASELGVGERVRLTGRRKDVGACLEMSDAYVFPTLFEGFGIALVEAMFKRLASAASRVGPIPEIIEDGASGLLFAPGSVAELQAAMETLHDDPVRRRSIAARGFQSARERFHSELTIPQWEHLYREVARREPGTATEAATPATRYA